MAVRNAGRCSRRHLDERVCRVKVVGAELSRLLLDKRLANLPEERIEGSRNSVPGTPPSLGAGESGPLDACLQRSGTCPVNPCSTGVMPSARSRADLLLEVAVRIDPRAGSGPPQPSTQPIQPNGK